MPEAKVKRSDQFPEGSMLQRWALEEEACEEMGVPMFIVLYEQCEKCKYYLGEVEHCVWACEAFNSIPKEIARGDHDHRKPFKGDHGITFEPK